MYGGNEGGRLSGTYVGALTEKTEVNSRKGIFKRKITDFSLSLVGLMWTLLIVYSSNLEYVERM
jgi:hypothetical protein